MRLSAILFVLVALGILPVAASANDFSPFKGSVEVVNSQDHIDVHADGTSVESINNTYKVLDQRAVELLRKSSFKYSESLSDFQIHSAFIVKADGTKVQVPKENYQIESASGRDGASPLISDIKTETVIFPNVQVGDSLTLSFSNIQHAVAFRNQFSYILPINDHYICDNLEFSISAPAAMPIQFEAVGVNGGETAGSNGRRNWIWHYSNHTIAPPERSASINPLESEPHIYISTFKSYGAISKAYEELFSPKASITPRIQSLADSITVRAKTQRQIVDAIYIWVARNIRYEYNLVGLGMLIPHDSDMILNNKLGDCKDHVLLVQALLAAENVQSSAALIEIGNLYHLPTLPLSEVFNHIITYVPSLHLYLDSTAPPLPLGKLPHGDLGKPTIHVSPYNGIQYTPSSNGEDTWARSTSDISYHRDGSADGTVQSFVSGDFAEVYHSVFALFTASPYSSTVVQRLLQRSGLRGSGHFTFDNPNTIREVYHFTLHFHLENAIDVSGPGAMGFNQLVAGSFVPVNELAQEIGFDRPVHEYHCTGGLITVVNIYHLPNTVKIIAIPKDIHMQSAFGRYDSHYEQNGSTVISTREVVDKSRSNLCTPDIYDGKLPLAITIQNDLRKQFFFTETH